MPASASGVSTQRSEAEAVAEPGRRAEDAAGAADVLAEHHHVVIALHLDVERVVHGLHIPEAQPPRILRNSARSCANDSGGSASACSKRRPTSAAGSASAAGQSPPAIGGLGLDLLVERVVEDALAAGGSRRTGRRTRSLLFDPLEVDVRLWVVRGRVRRRAVGDGLDEARPLPARPRATASRGLVDGEHVAAVDAGGSGDPVAGGLVHERLGLRLRRVASRCPLLLLQRRTSGAHHRPRSWRLRGRRPRRWRRRRRRSARTRCRRVGVSPMPDPPRAAPGSRSERRSRRGCSRPGSTSPLDGRATRRGSSPRACRAGARSPTRGSSGRSSRRPRGRGTRPPGSPRGPRRSRTCRFGPGGGRRRSARRTSAAGSSSGRARAAPARRAPRPRRPGRSRRRRSRGGDRAPRASGGHGVAIPPRTRVDLSEGRAPGAAQGSRPARKSATVGSTRTSGWTACRRSPRTTSTYWAATYAVKPTTGRSIWFRSPHWFGAPPLGSPTSRARVERSTTAAKLPAAENVIRPSSRTTLPRSGALIDQVDQGPIGRVVAAAVRADVEYELAEPGFRAARRIRSTSDCGGEVTMWYPR